MNYTEKYHLPQWEETDRIMRVDFNEAMANLEEGISEAKVSTDSYVIGHYVGLGETQKITLGFPPRFLIITQSRDPDNSADLFVGNTVAFYGSLVLGAVTFDDDGFTLNKPPAFYPSVNHSDRYYGYIAFR